MALAVSEVRSWSKFRRASATGSVGSTLRAVVGAQVSLAPERPECVRDREFAGWLRAAETAALQPFTVLSPVAAEGRSATFAAHTEPKSSSDRSVYAGAG